MLWYEVDYMKEFACKCGLCRTSCCDSWNIALTEDEYHRLNNANCSDELFHKIQSAICVIDDPTPDRYCVFTRNFLGMCPMHNEEGLCALQLELGAEALPEVCRVYPRSMHRKGDRLRAVCSAGCEAVVEILFERDHLDIIPTEDDLPVTLIQPCEPGFHDRMETIISVMRDRSISIKERVERVCTIIDPSFKPIQEPSAALRETLRVIDVLKTYSPTLSDLADRIGDRYEDISLFLEDRSKFDTESVIGERWIENLLINHLIYTDFPEVDERIHIEDSVSGLCLVYALVRLFCIFDYQHSKEDMIDSIAAVFRYTEHSALYYNAKVAVKQAEFLTSL